MYFKYCFGIKFGVNNIGSHILTGYSHWCSVRPLPDGNDMYWDICRKFKVRQCDKISCFISCFSTSMTWKIDVTEKDSKFIESVRGPVRGRFGRNTCPRGRNFALLVSGRSGFIPKKYIYIYFFLFFIRSAHHRQGLMTVKSQNILFLFWLNVKSIYFSNFIKKKWQKVP